MKDFDARTGWIPIARALEEIVTPAAGDNAWEQVKTALRREALRARCCADGVAGRVEPAWLPFAMSFEGEGAAITELPRGGRKKRGVGTRKAAATRRRGTTSTPSLTAPRELTGNSLYFDRHSAKEKGIDAPFRVDRIELSLEDCKRLWQPRVFPVAQAAPVNHRRDAVAARLVHGDKPGTTIMWEPFCDAVRADCGIQGTPRGWGGKSIQRAVQSLARQIGQMDK